MARRADEIIAYHLCWDMRDVTEGKYQNYTNPGIYVCGEDYFCCPTEKQKLHKDFDWELVGSYYGRNVYRSRCGK